MENSRGETLGEILRPWKAKFAVGVPLFITLYQFGCDQFGLPTIPKLWGMTGPAIAWWGWLLVAQVGFVYAMFEYMRRIPQTGPRAAEIDHLNDKLKRLQEIQEGAKMAAAAGTAASTSWKGKPLTRLTRQEQERLSRTLLSMSDFLTEETKIFLLRLNALREAERVMKIEGGNGYHAMVEAARPTVPKFIQAFRDKLKLHADDLRVADITSPSLIEDKAIPIKAALQGLSDVTQLLPANSANTIAIKPLIYTLVQTVETFEAEVKRVLNDIQVTRLRMSKGEFD